MHRSPSLSCEDGLEGPAYPTYEGGLRPGEGHRALLELEKRLYRYAKVGPELLEMADEGLVLAARAKARLGQALSAAQHTGGHLQIVGVGNWQPTSPRPAWNAEPRLTEDEDS